MSFKIDRLQLACGAGGFWIQDQPAIQTGAEKDGFFYDSVPITPGFRNIKEPAYAYCASLRLPDGAYVDGDCVTVVNVGYAGRPAPIRHENVSTIERMLKDRFDGVQFDSFQDAASNLEDLPLPLDTSIPIAYGVSQALL